MDELTLVDWLRERLPQGEGVLLGPGDDCALLNGGMAPILAATVDTLLEGSHFLPETDGYDVGWKTLAVSLSDLAAMGCRPLYALTGMGIRRGVAEAWIYAFAEGLATCAETFGLSLVGGDITSGSGPTSITLTALGTPWPGGPIRRSGARAGDVIAVTGSLGGSIYGHHLRFTPRLEESKRLCASGRVTAMMDLSDGIALDLCRLCRESGTGAILDASLIPVSEAARRSAEASGHTPLHHALSDGEDFELLFTVAREEWATLARGWDSSTPLTRIGEMTSAGGEVMISVDGEGRRPLKRGGYVHEFN